jgi:hypothetical protein
VKRQALALVLLLVCFLAACSSSDADESIRIGQDLLRAYATQPGLEYNLYRRVTWDEGDRLVGELDDAAFPDWARGAFSACVRWEESFHRDITNPETGPGEPTHVRQTGHAEGWILVGEDMRYHILELTVTFDGQTFDWIRAWEPPE